MTSAVLMPLLLEALGSVDTELARVTYALRDLAAWPAYDSPDLGRARAAIRRAFAGLRTVRSWLVEAGDDSPEIRACALRARGIVVLLQLAELRHHDLGDALGASFTSLDAFAEHVLACVGRANTCWVGHADDPTALIRAEQSFAEIATDPAVANVLARGALATNPHVRLTWATLGALLDAPGGGTESRTRVPTLPSLVRQTPSAETVHVAPTGTYREES